MGGALQNPFGKVGAKASSVRNYEHDYVGEPKRFRSRRSVGPGGSSSCIHRYIPTRRAFGFPNVRRDRAKRVFKQTCALGSPRAMSVPLPLLGVGGPVKNLILKVSKQGYLSFNCSFVRCFAWAT